MEIIVTFLKHLNASFSIKSRRYKKLLGSLKFNPVIKKNIYFTQTFVNCHNCNNECA